MRDRMREGQTNFDELITVRLNGHTNLYQHTKAYPQAIVTENDTSFVVRFPLPQYCTRKDVSVKITRDSFTAHVQIRYKIFDNIAHIFQDGTTQCSVFITKLDDIPSPVVQDGVLMLTFSKLNPTKTQTVK